MPVAGTAAAAALAWTAVGTAAIGTAVSVYGAVQQGKAAEDQAKYQEDIERNKAISARQQAEFAERQVIRRNKLVLGKQRAAAAKSGVLIDGSVSDVIEDSTVQGELDRLATLYSGEMTATSAMGQAQMYGAAAKNIGPATLLTATGTALSGVSKATSMVPSRE